MIQAITTKNLRIFYNPICKNLPSNLHGRNIFDDFENNISLIPKTSAAERRNF